MIGAFIAKIMIRRAFEAVNNHDLHRFMSAWREDCTFIYPGDIPASGKFEGKAATEKWFKNFSEQFPKIKFTVKHVCVDRIFDFTGTNTVAAQWDIDVTNREGKTFHNCGFTLIFLKFGKVFFVQDFIFDTGEIFKKAWSVK